MNKEIAKKVVDIVSEEFGVDREFVTQKSRRREFVYPRKAAYALMRRYCAYNLIDIAHYFGRKEHSTILHHIADAKHMLEHEYAFTSCYKRAEKRVRDMVLIENKR